MKAPGRNDSCWCGSGVKYKKCHLNKEAQTPVAPYTVTNALKNFKKEKKCSVPQSLMHECSGKIINAHSVSKSSSLKAIAEDGHVLALSVKLKSGGKPAIEIEKTGINNASTFTGFCAVHDKNLFSPIEDFPFDATPPHCFLVTYRGVSKELFSKAYASKVFGIMKTLDKGRSLYQQLAIQAASKSLGGSNDLTTGDLSYIKQKLDGMLTSDDYQDLGYTIFTLESPPPIMGSAIVAPTFDFEGQEAQKISRIPSEMPDYMAINAFSSEGKGYIVLSWLAENSETCIKIVRQFIDKRLSSDSLAVFIILLIENFYISPKWWSELDAEAQCLIKGLCSQGIEADTHGDSIKLSIPLNFPAITNISTSHLF